MPASIKPNLPFIALALITITLSSWGLYRLMVDFADCPPWFAALAVGGADLLAVVCGKQAIDVAGDGDSPAFWNLAMLVITGVAAWLQFSHTQLAGQPLAVGVIMAVFPVATVLLFEGRLRRAARLQGRARGTVAPPRRRVPLLVMFHFPADAWRTNRKGIRAQGHLDDDTPPKPRVRPERAIEPAPAPVAPVRNGHDRQQTVAASVRAASDRLGNRDIDAVLAEVQRTTHPAVSRDTVRRNLSRIETNGHVHA